MAPPTHIRSRAGVAVLAATACLASAARAATQTGFLASPTDQVAVPGALAAGEITPEGDLYTGWAEYEWRFGARLRDWNQPTRTLPDPALPLLISTRADGPVLYRQSVFAVTVGGEPVAYETISATNTSGERRTAQVAMQVAYTRGRQIAGAHGLTTGAYRFERPVSAQAPGYYEQPGQPFSPAFSYTLHGRDLDRSGLLLARGPDEPSRALKTPSANGPTTPHEARLFATTLAAHASASWTWQIPLQPPPATATADAALDAVSPARARKDLKRLWAAQEAGMASIEVPEKRVGDAYRAAVAQILSSRFWTPAGWVQVTNRLQYQAFWIRDAALQAQALDLAGLHAPAEQDLAFMDSFQRSDGLFISRPFQYDGLGQALWALARHAQLTQSPTYAAAQLARMSAAIAWLSTVTATDPLGLLPAAEPGDDELAYGHLAGDDLWAAAGLRAAVADARLAGRADLAGRWQALDERFESAVDRALAAAVARAGHVPPVLDSGGGQDWGNYFAAYPAPVLAPSSRAVSATLAWERAHSAQGLATYENGRSLHDYLGFPIFETELERGEASRALAGLYAELAHTTATYGGWEWDVSPRGYRGSPFDMSPHATFSADYVTLLRDMLVAEPAPATVRLMDGASPAWQRPGQRVSVTGAPTADGVVSFAERAGAHGETLTWTSDLAPGTTLQWRLPWWARRARTATGAAISGSTVRLSGASGSLTVTFSGQRPSQSYALAVRALDGEYRRRGRAAPIVAVGR